MSMVSAIVIATLIISLHVVAHVTYKRTKKNAATRTTLNR